MKVRLINEMTITTRDGYKIRYECNEKLDLLKDKEDNLLLKDCDDNIVKVDDDEIFEAVLKNSAYGEEKAGRAKVSLRKVCEEADPELVADFLAATNQVPNEKAEDGAEEHLTSEEGGLDDLEVEVPVTVTKDVPYQDKVDVLVKEQAFEDIAPDAKEFEAASVELVDDAPEFTKDQSDRDDATDIDENDGKNDPDVSAPDEKPAAKGDEFYEARLDIAQMKEEVELKINTDGSIDICSGEGATEEPATDVLPDEEPISEEDNFIEPELGAAGVDAPEVDEPETEPVITEEDEGDSEENPIKNVDDDEGKEEDEPESPEKECQK